jgi:hypothetical protein
MNEAFVYFLLLVRMVQILNDGWVQINLRKLFTLVVSECQNRERGGD